MFIGHYAVALAAKRTAPSVSLGTLLLASQLMDLLFPVLVLLGIERVRILPGNTAVSPLDFSSYPFSHSLLAAILLSVAFGMIYYSVRRSRRGAWVLAALVLLHWVLDLISHPPDLQLFPGSGVRVGLGLWHSVAATIVIEGGLFAAGLLIYTRSTKPIDRKGSYGFWLFLLLLIVLYAGNLFGPPPPDPHTLAWVSFSQWIFIAWAYWFDAHRTPIMR